MPRDFKRSIGEKISAECIEIMVLVFRANARMLGISVGRSTAPAF
jgi:hypothetical protein